MALTPNRNFRFPDGTDTIDFDVHIANLANDLDTALENISSTSITTAALTVTNSISAQSVSATTFTTDSDPSVDNALARRKYITDNFLSKTTTSSQSMAGGLTISNAVVIDKGAQALTLKPGSNDHVYIGWYADLQNPNTRTGYLGVPSDGSLQFNLYAEKGNLDIRATDATVNLGNVNIQSNKALSLYGGTSILLNAPSITIDSTNDAVDFNGARLIDISPGTSTNEAATVGQITQIYYFSSNYNTQPPLSFNGVAAAVGDVAINTYSGEHWKFV